MPSNFPVTTVWIAADHLTPDGAWWRKMFFCSYCGKPVAKYVGLVELIVPGRAPVQLPVEIKCGNNKCNAVYSFQAILEHE